MEGREEGVGGGYLLLFSSPELASKRFSADSGTNGRKEGVADGYFFSGFCLQSFLPKNIRDPCRLWDARKDGRKEGRKVLQVATSLTGESTVRAGIIHLLQQQATACCAGCYLIIEHAHSFQFTRSMP